MKAEFFIARRHITRSGGAFRKIISAISIGGVATGVGAMIIAMSMENGLHKDLKDRILASSPDVIVKRFHHEMTPSYNALMEKLSKIKNVQKVEPFISEKGMLKTADEQEGAMIKGVSATADIPNLTGDTDGIVLGSILASSLGVIIGDSVTLFSIVGQGYSRVKTKKFMVSGIFEGSMYEYNAVLAYLPLSEAQKFFEIGEQVTGIELDLDNIYKAPEVSKTINKEMGYPYYATNWIEMNINLFAALKLERIALSIILTLIIVVACFGIAATLIMLITQKTREIGVLRAMGATSGMIKRTFMLEGILTGTTGAVIGIILGFIASYLIGKYKFISLPPGIYGTDTLPVCMKWLDFVIIGFGAIFISFVASLYPATRAAKLLPAEAIRYE